MYLNYESWAEVKNIPYSIDSTQTQVKFVGSHGEYSAHDYQKKAVLAMHAKRRRILKFQNAFVQLQQECNKLEESGFDVSMNISLPIKQAIVTGDYKFSLSVQTRPVQESEAEFDPEKSKHMWKLRRTFYTMTRENKSTATLIVIEKLVKRPVLQLH
jgi:hypothetical protein